MPLTRSPAAQTRIAIDQAILDRLDEIRPQYMDRTTFINFQLDSTLTLNSPSAQARGPWGGGDLINKDDRAREELINRPPSDPPKAPKDPWTLKKVSPALVPEELDSVAELFCEWWAARAKGATFTQSVAKREFKKLLGWSSEDRTKALQSAIASGWKQLYEPKPDKPAQGHYGAPETPHPASKVFKASDLDWPEPTHAVLQDLV